MWKKEKCRITKTVYSIHQWIATALLQYFMICRYHWTILRSSTDMASIDMPMFCIHRWSLIGISWPLSHFLTTFFVLPRCANCIFFVNELICKLVSNLCRRTVSLQKRSIVKVGAVLYVVLHYIGNYFLLVRGSSYYLQKSGRRRSAVLSSNSFRLVSTHMLNFAGYLRTS